TPGISAQSGITTLSGKKCLDLWGQIQSTPFKISHSDNLYCKSEDFEKIVELIKGQIRCAEIKYIKGHPMT
ncbi:hypothetical protein QPK60_07020, partial [Aeromonas caviae]|nr:hypothetical protein [Aeromonas caviae]